jgi:hypothetical protein
MTTKITELNNITEQSTQKPVSTESKGCLNARTVAYAAVATGVAVAVAAAFYYVMQTNFTNETFATPQVSVACPPAFTTIQHSPFVANTSNV